MEFMIPIALLKEFGVRTFEVTYMRKCSGKGDKLRNVYTIRETLRDIAIKEREINNIKIKINPFIIYFSRNCIIVNR